ncbi:MAG: rod shape-determining protein MreC [Nitrospinae bacterium]|nr:rod shape-determining protein MreC [Nitrospinota bacterium]MBI3814721.1 rod shape-determining protein MreC [Nitrospinota bacterium]
MLKKNGSKKRHGIIVVTTLIVISFLFLTANIKFGEAPTSVESIVVSIISPFQELVSKTVNSINRLWSSYIYLINTQEENYRLKREMEQLEFKNNTLAENLNRFQRLERLSDLIKTSEDMELLPADVVGFDSTGWSKMLIINKGLNNAVKKDMAVVTYNGLLGRIVQSTSKYSKVLLITDPRSAVGAVIQRTRDRGIAVGTNNNMCEMKYLSVNSDVKSGDLVISSGLGSIFQKGLVIGTISRVYEKKMGLFRNVEITPTADLAKTEELLVVTSPFEKPEVK